MNNDLGSLKRYVILGLARSGTTVVHFALKGHPNVAALNDEVKVAFFTEGISIMTMRDDNTLEKKVSAIPLFDTIAGVFADDNTQALGLKCITESVEVTRELVQALSKYYKEMKIILVIRDDLTAQYGSMQRARITGEWHSWRKSGRFQNQKVKLSKREFGKYVKRSIAKLKELRALKNTHDVLEFNFEEQLLSAEGPDFSPLFKFLEISDLKVTWLDSKKVAPPPEDYILNYEKMNKFCDEILQSESIS